MTRLIHSCARGILAALMLTSVVRVPPAVAETVLRIANLAEPESLDPHKTVLQFQINITRNLFEGLVVLDPKGNVAPGVAESWSVSQDGLSYRFKLRADAKWSNGAGPDPVLAEPDGLLVDRHGLLHHQHLQEIGRRCLEGDLDRALLGRCDAERGHVELAGIDLLGILDRVEHLGLCRNRPWILETAQ